MKASKLFNQGNDGIKQPIGSLSYSCDGMHPCTTNSFVTFGVNWLSGLDLLGWSVHCIICLVASFCFCAGICLVAVPRTRAA